MKSTGVTEGSGAGQDHGIHCAGSCRTSPETSRSRVFRADYFGWFFGSMKIGEKSGARIPAPYSDKWASSE